LGVPGFTLAERMSDFSELGGLVHSLGGCLLLLSWALHGAAYEPLVWVTLVKISS